MTDISGARRGAPTGFSIDMRVAALLLAIVAVLARIRVFGDPVVQVDEQFYLLVGGRMLHGAIPYVDIWDRKPIGLFLLFAGFRAFGGSGVIAYQIGALVSVWATALILFAMARRIAPPAGALASAVLYLLWLDLAGGEGGQSPVYYNLLVAAAIAIIFFARSSPAGRRGEMRVPGIASMLLFGIALQIKYSVVFEGMFAGIALLVFGVRGSRRWSSLALDAVLWIACALVPTLLAIGAYSALGHLGDWWFANATSILKRGSEQHGTIVGRVEVMIYLLVPLIVCVPLRRWIGTPPASERERDDRRFLDAWAAVALLGVVLFGTWFNHYALPLFAPLGVVAAPLWGGRFGRAWLLTLMLGGMVWGQRLISHHQVTRGSARLLAGAAAATRGAHGCIFVYDGYPALYDVTNSCLPTTRPFPAHLQSRNELDATGIDEVTEVRRIFATRPERVMAEAPAYDEENPAARAEAFRWLNANYVPIFVRTERRRSYIIYGLRGTIGSARPVPVSISPLSPVEG